MANDAYSCPPGSVIAAGRSVYPVWVPPIGTLSSMSLNNLEDTRGTDDLSQTRAIMTAWSGAAYVSSWGRYGSIICTGGGHADGFLNAVYRFDVETRLWSKIKNSAIPHLNAASLIADSVTGWMWADASGTTVQTGEPFAAHMYSGLVGLPASAIPGGGNGWIISAGRSTMPATAASGTKQSSKLNLGQGNLFTAHGLPLVRGTGYGGACWDMIRNRLISFAGLNTVSYCFLELATEIVGAVAFTKVTGYAELDGYNCSVHHDVASDLYYVTKATTPFSLRIVDPSGLITDPPISGTPPSGTGGWEWVEVWGALVYYPGTGSTVWFLKRPSNPLTGTWIWSSQTAAGTANNQAASNPHYRRFLYIPSVACFLWVAAANQPVQAFHLASP